MKYDFGWPSASQEKSASLVSEETLKSVDDGRTDSTTMLIFRQYVTFSLYKKLTDEACCL